MENWRWSARLLLMQNSNPGPTTNTPVQCSTMSTLQGATRDSAHRENFSSSQFTANPRHNPSQNQRKIDPITGTA